MNPCSLFRLNNHTAKALFSKSAQYPKLTTPQELEEDIFCVLLTTFEPVYTCSKRTLLTVMVFSCRAICLARKVNNTPTWLGCTTTVHQ